MVKLQCCDLTRVESQYIIPTYYRYFCWCEKYHGGGSTEAFLRTVWVYPRKVKADNGNFKKCRNLPPECYYKNIILPIPLRAFQACALILPLCHKERLHDIRYLDYQLAYLKLKYCFDKDLPSMMLLWSSFSTAAILLLRVNHLTATFREYRKTE